MLQSPGPGFGSQIWCLDKCLNHAGLRPLPFQSPEVLGKQEALQVS